MTRRAWATALPAVAGMAGVVAATGKGLYVSPDAVFYVGTARNLLAGRGFRPPPGLPPPGHFPPLFPVVLAGLGRLGLDPLDAARVVNVGVLGAVVVLVGLLVRWATSADGAGLVASVLAAVAVDLLASAASPLSEPMFVLLVLAAVGALAAHLTGRSRGPGWLLAASALAAAACLTRYVGVALVVAGLAALVRFGRNRRWHGAADAAVFGLLATAPVLAYLVWAGRAEGGTGDRSLAWHPFGWDYLGQAARPLSRWMVPWPRPPIGLVLALLVVGAAVILLRRRRPDGPGPVPAPLQWLLCAFALSYLAVVVANRLFTDATGRLDARFLTPLHMVAILLVVPALFRRRIPGPAVALAGVLLVAQVVGAVAWTVGGLTDDGIARRGYSAAVWRRSPVMARIAATDPSVPVYSNGFDAVAFLTSRSATPIPARTQYLSGRPNPDYTRQIDAMRADLERGGMLAYLDAATFRRSFLPSLADLEHDLPLEKVASDGVGTLYRLRPTNR